MAALKWTRVKDGPDTGTQRTDFNSACRLEVDKDDFAHLPRGYKSAALEMLEEACKLIPR